MRPRVLVSHPGRQHAHHLVYALQEGGYLTKFITSLWYKPERFPYRLINLLPSGLKKSIENELKKRYYEKIEEEFIEQCLFFEPFREGIERLLKRYKSELSIYLGNRIHDLYVSRRINRLKPDIVVGYETSSLKTFKKARGLSIVTILDLAQAHYKFIDGVRGRYTEYDKTFDSKVSDKVNRLKNKELNYADYIITLSDLVKETLISFGIPEDKIYLAKLGFSPERFTLKETYGKDGVFQILYVGAITKRKGIRLLLEAYKGLNLRNSELILIGEIANENDFLENYRGIYKHIPYLNQERLASYYQSADVFVFPSYLDSWGMVVIEAMACGTPVIVSENTGAKEVVVNDVNGFIIPVEDIAALKEKILFFYNNRDDIEHFGRNARRQVENYTWENYRKKTREIVAEIWKAKDDDQ